MRSSLLFRNLQIVNCNDVIEGDIRVGGGRIREMNAGLHPGRGEEVYECGGMFAYPGLINAHDHLQFNLYPRIGNPPYGNAYEWGNDILMNYRDVVDPIEAVAIRKRYLWGAWKNLFSGATFVVHHDPWSMHFGLRFPVWVLSRYSMAHSLGNEKRMTRALSRRPPRVPFIIHLAEGVDNRAASEVASLHEMGGIDHRTVAVHAVAVTRDDITTLQQAKASIVWCPSSNLYLFGKTIPHEAFSSNIPIALGTDSTLTGSITLFDEMRIARSHRGCGAREIMEMVSAVPRRIFDIRDAGEIGKGCLADFFLLPPLRADPYETLLSATPADIQMLVRDGKIMFTDQSRFPSRVPGKDSLRVGTAMKEFSDRRCVKLFHELRMFLGHYSYLSGEMS